MRAGILRKSWFVSGLFLFLYGCNATMGGGIGFALCSAFIDNKYRAVAASICSLAGAYIGQKLNEREKAQLAEATYESFDRGVTKTIVTEQGNTIRTERVGAKRGKSTSKSQSRVAVANGECGSVKQTVVTKDAQKFEQTVQGCKRDGVWVIN